MKTRPINNHIKNKHHHHRNVATKRKKRTLANDGDVKRSTQQPQLCNPKRNHIRQHHSLLVLSISLPKSTKILTMRLSLAAALLVTVTSTGEAFTLASRSSSGRCQTQRVEEPSTTTLKSTAEILVEDLSENVVPVEIVTPQEDELEGSLTDQLFNARLERQLEKLRLKDQTSKQLTKEDLVIVHEDKNILVVDKPSGVLTVAGKDRSNPSLADAVYQNTKTDLPSADHMVVHRLGMDTSGLIIMAKNKNAVRELNGVFRERKVDRRYEALVAGHIEKDEGIINLPIMRDYERPPYVRISTDDHQRALLVLDPEEVGKKVWEGPKASVTKYEVVGREFLQGQPVTRVVLTSISGRYHQLNVHMAAFGHPIVGDQVYGHGGDALSNGGLTKHELDELAPNPNRATEEMQMLLNETVTYKNMPPCVHAKYIKFVHPVTKKTFEFSTDSPF